MYYIGIDVSKKDLSIFDGDNDLNFKNTEGLKAFKRYLKKRYRHFDNLGILFEATGIYSEPLQAFCAHHKIKAYRINPKQSHNFARSLGVRSKTDTIDARTIHAYQKLIPEESLQVPVIDLVARKLSGYLTSYQFIQKQRISLANHLEGIREKSLLKRLQQELKRIEHLEEDLLGEVKAYICAHPRLKEDYERLLTIPGIGEKAAFTLLTFFQQYPDTNRAQVTALAGLDPIQKESGTSVKGKAKISKNGNRALRKMLYMPTLCAIKYNRKMADFYERLLSHHKPKMVAVIAVMRKLLLVAHALYRSKTAYVPI